MQVETFKQKCHRLQHEFNTYIMEKSSGHHRQNLRWIGSSLNVVKGSYIQTEKEKSQKSTKKNQLGTIQMIVREYDKQNKSIEKEKHRKIEIIYPPEGIQK